MEKKPLGIMLAGTALLLIAYLYAYFNPITTIYAEIPFPIVIISFFLAGTVFFGYFTFIPLILFGLEMGAQKNAAIFLYLIPAIISAYAGAKFGTTLQEDFNKKRNYIKETKIILAILLTAIVLAVIIEAVLPTIIQLWPKDFLGMNVTQGKGIVELIQDMAELI